MSSVFFTADTHFDHGGIGPDGERRGILKYRPQFDSLEEMEETIVDNWNCTVGKNDTVWHLGDFGFKTTKIPELVRRLNGYIRLVLGNHDKDWPWSSARVMEYGFVSVTPAHYLRHAGHRLYLHHYPCRSWRNSSHGAFHLYGHSHGDMPGLNRSMDVGVDAQNFTPISFEDVFKRLDELPSTEHHPELGE